MSTRRLTLVQLAAVALSGLPAWAVAAQQQSLVDPFRLAVDDAIADSGLASHLQRAFGRETGIAIEVLRGPASTVLGALERGEHDAAITNAPAVELPLEKEGLVHDRQRVARSDFVLVGPSMLAKPLAAGQDVVVGLARLAQAQALFLSRHDGSGTHLAEQAAWRAAQVAPAAPWYLEADAGSPLLAQARRQKACVLVEHGVWAAEPPSRDYGLLAGGDPRLAVEVHIMRTFRAPRQHPVGRLFTTWLTGPKGRAVVAAHKGYAA